MRAISTFNRLALGLVLLIAGTALYGRASARSVLVGSPRGPSSAPAIRDIYGRVAANNLDLVVSNFGSFGHRFDTGGPGLRYPKGTYNWPLFAGGIWIGAKGAGVVRHAAAEYNSEFFQGTAPAGAASPDDPRFRNYTIIRGDMTSADYLEWPIQDGAPADLLGRPEILGDVHSWSVFNDANDRSYESGGTPPLQIEVRQSTFAYAGSPGDSNTIYLRFRIRNTGPNLLDSAFVGLWLDPDLGDYRDDLVGCDTTLALGYCYNATNLDEVYGTSPPAIGIVLLQGPTAVPAGGGPGDTLGATAFYGYPYADDPPNSVARYLVMRGLKPDGSPIHLYDDPFGAITPFRYSGDPVTSSGWLDQSANDRRLLLSAGPFRMAAGDSQEIVAALVVGQGADRLSSITDLRARAAAAHALAHAGFPPSGSPSPTLVAPPGVTGFLEEPVEFLVRLLGDDGTAWSIGMDEGPTGASFQDLGGNVGRFTWTPSLDQAGVLAASFSASRAGFGVRRISTDLLISRRNHPPAITPIPDFVAYLEQTTEQPFEATDPDGDDLVAYDCSQTSWHGRSVIVTQSSPGHVAGVIRVAPSREFGDDVATVASRLCVSDQLGPSASQSFQILVRNAPRPPYLNATDSTAARVGQIVSATARLIDVNETDTLRLEASGYPSSLHVERKVASFPGEIEMYATLSGVPRPEDVGTYTVIWRGSDGSSPEISDTTRLEILPRLAAQALPPALTSSFLAFPLDGPAMRMASGDFNGDGTLDVASVSPFGLVGTLLGRTGMEFTLPFDYVVPGKPLGVASGDWNRDGATDLAIVCDSSAALQVLSSRGDGSFEIEAVDVGAPLLVSIAAADFDGDGALDLAVGMAGQTGVVFLRGDGAGGFQRVTFVGTTGTPLGIAVADWNRDGTPDMAIALPRANNVSVYLGPLFESPPPVTTITTVNFPRFLCGDDFTNDGIPDLVVVGHAFFGGTVVVARGRGDGTFDGGTLTPLQDYSASAASGDFDGDGYLDLAVGFAYSNNAGEFPFDPYETRAPRFEVQDPGITILYGRGDGTLAPRSDIAYTTTASSLAAADLDGDGREDLLAVAGRFNSGNGSLLVFPGRPQGAVQRSPGITTTEPVGGMVLADLDANGAADVAATSGAQILVWMNPGDASFGPPAVFGTPSGATARTITTGDFNGDGFADLALTSNSPPSLLAMSGHPGGAPGGCVQVAAPDTIGGDKLVTEFRSAASFDLDHDGYDDLVALVMLEEGSTSSVGILHFQGSASGLKYRSCVATGIRATAPSLIVGEGGIRVLPYSFFGRDVTDADGNPIPTPSLFSWDAALRPLGAQVLPFSTGFDSWVGSIAEGDFDGDGIQDLAVGMAFQYSPFLGFAVLPGTPDGSLGPPIRLQDQRVLGSLVARDFNGDGIADVAAVDQNDPSVVMTFGRLGGVAGTVTSVGYGLPAPAGRSLGAPGVLAVGDLNRDGAPDLAVYCSEAGQIAFLFNQTAAAPAGILERYDASVERVLLEWRTLATAGSAATVMRFDAASGTSRASTATVQLDGRVVFEDTAVSPGSSYLYRLRVRRAGSEALTEAVHVDVPPAPPVPAAPLHLAPAAPNPIREAALIGWNLPAPGKTSIRVFDAQGRKVATLFDGFATAGSHDLRWSGHDQNGKRLASGVYWIRLESPEGVRTRKVVIAR